MKFIKKIIVIIAIGSLIGINLYFQFFYKAEINSSTIERPTIYNPTINNPIINIGSCNVENQLCPRENQLKFISFRFSGELNQNAEFIIPTGKHGILKHISEKQDVSIAYCFCDGKTLLDCQLLPPFFTEPYIESNYSIANYSNVSVC